MRFWYHLSEYNDREYAKRRGEEPLPITLYKETKQIVKEFQTPENIGGWELLWDASTDECEFDSFEEAYKRFYEIHDDPAKYEWFDKFWAERDSKKGEQK